ncbi:hypothetical protein PAXINDRAFT_66612, partial [Paxillus involutus ATCC 200175]
HKLIIKAWRQYFAALKQDLANAKGSVSFTSDIWSDENYWPFVAITAHWISKGDNPGSLKLNAGERN